MSDSPINDGEVVYHRIPSGESYFEPPDRISSRNFKLRPNELGISVYRASIVDAQNVLERPGVPSGCKIAAATVGQIRSARDGMGNLLHLNVIAVNDENDPGHAEIRSPVAGTLPPSASKALKKLFKVIESVPA